MRQLLWCSILFLFSLPANGQQEAHLTQFPYVLSAFNPAYVNAPSKPTLTAVFRSQWSGIEGAPSSQWLNGILPFTTKNIGVGINIRHASIGIQDKLDLAAMYGYKLNLGRHEVSLGLQASARRLVNDFSDPRLVALDGWDLDPAIERVRYSQSIFNLGLGARLKLGSASLGISAPRLIKANIDQESGNFIARETRHLYVNAGAELQLNSIWDFRPAILYTLTENGPDDLDVFASFVYKNQVHLGVNLRLGGSDNTLLESADLILGLAINDRLFASMGFDFTFTELRHFENGSFELLVSYQIGSQRNIIPTQNPRYF